MQVFQTYLNKIDSPEKRGKLDEILTWIQNRYPDLEPVIKWNQPMFLQNGIFIIGFSISKNHISVSPEPYGINLFTDSIKQSGYTHTSNLFRILWTQEVNYDLFDELIQFKIKDKYGCKSFWK
ncbi:MAG: iron chaperone [Bacilli bacterium]|nr:iron chaperone [Bacilli bacterium]MBN2876175.1 iron chaperone [Bacilli bacterium]